MKNKFIIIFTFLLISVRSYAEFHIVVNPENVAGNILTLEVSDLSNSIVATCNSQLCFDNEDTESIGNNSYCDMTQGVTITSNDNIYETTGIAENGCIKNISDRSNYNNIGWTLHQFNKLSRPKYIPQCLNTFPCLEGFIQDGNFLSFSSNLELSLSNFESEVLSLSDEFSIFILYKHINSNMSKNCFISGENFCFGIDNYNRLYIELPDLDKTLNLRVQNQTWHLYEIHRHRNGSLIVALDSVEEEIHYLVDYKLYFTVESIMSKKDRSESCIGQFMSMYIYNTNLTNLKIRNMRQYVYEKYGVGVVYLPQ